MSIVISGNLGNLVSLEFIEALDNKNLKIGETIAIPYETVEGLGSIPTYLSTCPYCQTENKWRTTGLIVPCKCKGCNKYFKVW